jgi:S1-C subfamily serine protease
MMGVTVSAAGRATPVLVAGLLAGLVAAPGLSGQEGVPLEERDSARCFCPGDIPAEAHFRTMGPFRRAMLGVMLGEDTRAGDRDGVRIEEVTAGGPAERAGLRAGDVIVAMDGDRLGDDPAEAVVEHMSDVDPGETVEVEFVRDGQSRTARVVTEEAGPMAFTFRGQGPRVWVSPDGGAADFSVRRLDLERMRDGMREGLRGARFYLRRDALDLVDVNDDLGRYFGTDHGVLVASIEEGSELGLEAGDVILSVDGRDVRDAGHVHSILASYRDDEEIRFEVMRDRRSRTVTGRLGGDR